MKYLTLSYLKKCKYEKPCLTLSYLVLPRLT
jgi:hypothetical protein